MNSQKIGSRFEQDVKKSVKEYILRLRSIQGFKATDNPGDFLVYNGKYLLFLECKTVKENRLAVANVRKLQLWKLLEACANKNIFGGYLVLFRNVMECYFIETSLFIQWWISRDRQSIPYDWVKEHGIKIPMHLKRTRYGYDINSLYEWVEENCYVGREES